MKPIVYVVPLMIFISSCTDAVKENKEKARVNFKRYEDTSDYVKAGGKIDSVSLIKMDSLTAMQFNGKFARSYRAKCLDSEAVSRKCEANLSDEMMVRRLTGMMRDPGAKYKAIQIENERSIANDSTRIARIKEQVASMRKQADSLEGAANNNFFGYEAHFKVYGQKTNGQKESFDKTMLVDRDITTFAVAPGM